MILLFVFRLLRRRFYVAAERKLLERYDYVVRSHSSVPPEDLWIVVNGFLGSCYSGRDVCDLIGRSAASTTGAKSVVAVRVQACDLAFGLNLFSQGAMSAAQHVEQVVSQQLVQHPTLRRIHFVGNSFGGLVCRAVLPTLQASHPQLELGNFVSICSPHQGAIVPMWKHLIGYYVLQIKCADEVVFQPEVPTSLPLLLCQGKFSESFRSLRRRVAVASVDDELIALSSAHFGVAPDELVSKRSSEIPSSSKVLLVRQFNAVGGGRGTLVENFMQSMDWTLVYVTGRHSDHTRVWSNADALKEILLPLL